MTTADELRVCIDARIPSGAWGGVEQVVLGIAHGLRSIDAGTDKYLFLTGRTDDSWLRPYLTGPCSALRASPSGTAKTLTRRAAPAWRRVRSRLPLPRLNPRYTDGVAELATMHLIHFTFQDAFLTHLPSIYQPHDLQHIHLPEFFSRREIRWREAAYRVHCERARAVVVMTEWGRKDLIRHFSMPPDKVHVVPWASVLEAYAEPPAEVQAHIVSTLGLAHPYALFPSHTHPHKNHLVLLEALALLKRHHRVRIPLVCTGGLTAFHRIIERRLHELGLADQVRFTGYLTAEQMYVVYRQARCLVFPSLFEGWGMPVCEAFASRIPVACSNVTALPDVSKDAALLFDPRDATSIASALKSVWTDDALRAALVEKGRARSADFTWEKTALRFRALYRMVGGRTLSPADHDALNERSPA